MKEKEQPSFNFKDFKVTRKFKSRSPTSWKNVYASLLSFLDIRAQDSRAFNMDGVKQFEGIGYCILIPDLKDFIKKSETDNTTKSEFFQLYWPKKKKNEELPCKLVFPAAKDYREITPENAALALQAKKFCSGLEEKVVKAFKIANQEWLKGQVGYDLDNLPEKIDSPVQRVRIITRKKPIFIDLIREETPEYEQIISQLLTELGDLENDVSLKDYKTKKTGEGVYVNIENVSNRISDIDRLEEENLIKVSGKYEIVP